MLYKKVVDHLKLKKGRSYIKLMRFIEKLIENKIKYYPGITNLYKINKNNNNNNKKIA